MARNYLVSRKDKEQRFAEDHLTTAGLSWRDMVMGVSGPLPRMITGDLPLLNVQSS